MLVMTGEFYHALRGVGGTDSSTVRPELRQVREVTSGGPRTECLKLWRYQWEGPSSDAKEEGKTHKNQAALRFTLCICLYYSHTV